MELGSQDVVLEIGAGSGELTRELAPHVKKVLAVEIDPDLYLELKENTKDLLNVRVFCADILKFTPAKFLGSDKRRLKVAGNIPYYISTPILERILSWRTLAGSAFLTVQKEFAARITAASGGKDYGSLSCFVQFYSRPLALFDISRNCFFPRPKVDSSFLRLDIRGNTGLGPAQERRLFRVIRGAFNQRRKTLRNSLEGIVGPRQLEAFFDKYSIEKNVRPERLSLEDFVNLARI